jgi:predicted transcriptional regulator
LPEADFLAARVETPDPVRLAERFGSDTATVLRRWALLPESDEAGLVVCDASGTPVFRRSVAGFSVPSFGAGCPLWPIYEALSRPGMPVRRFVEQAGRLQRTFVAYAVAETSRPDGLDGPVLVEGTMLLLPDPASPSSPVSVGPSCRTCPRQACPARREPSVLGEK